jgi:hypothetical protein
VRGFALAILLIAAVAGPARASEIAPGAGTLRTLTSEAQFIVKIDSVSVEAAPEVADVKELPLTFTTYKATVRKVVTGDFKPDETIRIAIANHLAIKTSDLLENALIFLTPATTDLFNVSNLPRGETVFVVVGGRLGVVANADDATLAAVQRYVTRLDGPADSVGWAARHLGSADPFLQRSAIMDLYLQHDRAGALALLSHAVQADTIHEENRGFAMEALEATGKSTAKTPLKAVAEDAGESTMLRERAVEALSTLPGGASQISEWRKSKDALLSEAAERVVTETSQGPK